MRPIQTIACTSLLVLSTASCKKQEAEPTPPPPVEPEVKAPPPAPADAAPEKPKYTEITGFQTPESVYYWADQDVYLVSNIHGTPVDADDNGFISKVSPE